MDVNSRKEGICLSGSNKQNFLYKIVNGYEIERNTKGKGYVLRIGKDTFSYSYHSKKGFSLWYCSRRKKRLCRARVRLSDNVRYTLSQQGKVKVLFRGRYYTKDQVRDVKTRWRCYRRRGCTAYLVTISGELVRFRDTHNHD
ncbi:unnamed protein product [Leptosia nina]|uniref:FLYWCH-type domain-containing protein n=1 Tax=Leptosia nina TaxID=320188 RepID=A0AAV1J316_9NEOP